METFWEKNRKKYFLKKVGIQKFLFFFPNPKKVFRNSQKYFLFFFSKIQNPEKFYIFFYFFTFFSFLSPKNKK